MTELSGLTDTTLALDAAADPADDIGRAFVPGPRVELPPAGTGPLSGLRFAAKDLFDVAGVVTTFGNPDWARTHAPAEATAPVILSLLHAGGALVGKTKTVELAYGVFGQNIWHGTPRNAAAPDRFPGGSSCGSAAAVASGQADVALGSDTGGSVRIPASFCGLFGIRPTHGAVSLAGARALAPSFDTAGWFARDASTLARVGAVLLPGGMPAASGPILLVSEAWAAADPETGELLRQRLGKLCALVGRPVDISIAPEGLAELAEHFRLIQAEEAWATLGEWVTATNPQLGPGPAERVAAARTTDPARAAAARLVRQALQARVRPLLAGGAVLIMPTSPGPAPLLTTPMEERAALRRRTLAFTCIASLCGLPEVTLPAGRTADGAPIGLSLIGGFGSDRGLLALARQAAGVLGLPD